MPELQHKNKNAVVTGGSRGIGAETVRMLAKEGANVLITYVSELSQKKVDDLINEVQGYNTGSKCSSARADATSISSVSTVVEAANNAFGGPESPIHILVNNAGASHFKPLEQLTLDDFDTLYNANVRVPLFLIQTLVPRMNRGSRIINVTSRLARVVFPGSYLYTGSRSAMEGTTRVLATELKSRGITANIVAPGPIDTDALSTVRHLHKEEDVSPPDAVAGAILYLCCDTAQHITGATIPVNNGLWMG